MSKPRVAIVGASGDRAKYGNKSVRAHQKSGYEVFPIHPTLAEVEGLAAYPSVSDVPGGRLDRVSMYVPPTVGMTLIAEIAAKGCDEFWLNPGSQSPELIEKARAAGLEPIVSCSIVDLGVSPRDFGP